MNKRLNKLDHTIPIYSPRTTYKNVRANDDALLADLTLNFDPFTINVLKSEFCVRGWEMQLVDFVLVVKEHLLSWQTDIPNRELKLIRCLAILFQEIDLNGNGILEWDEFVNYVIDKATVLNRIKTKADEIKSYTKSNIVPLHISEKGKPMNCKFNNLLTKIIYIPNIDRLAFIEEKSTEIRFMNPETGVINAKSLKLNPNKDKEKDKKLDNFILDEKDKDGPSIITIVLDMLYIPDKNY